MIQGRGCFVGHFWPFKELSETYLVRQEPLQFTAPNRQPVYLGWVTSELPCYLAAPRICAPHQLPRSPRAVHHPAFLGYYLCL